MLFLLTIYISDCPCLDHIFEIRMNSLLVLFPDGSSSSYFSRKLFGFKAYVNSLDNLDCSLAVFYSKIPVSGSKFLYPSMKGVVGTCSCAISLDHLDFRLFMFGSHSRNDDKFTVSFISK